MAEKALEKQFQQTAAYQSMRKGPHRTVRKGRQNPGPKAETEDLNLGAASPPSGSSLLRPALYFPNVYMVLLIFRTRVA